MVKLEAPELDGITLPRVTWPPDYANRPAEELQNNAIITPAENNRPKKQRSRPKKVSKIIKVENKLNFDEYLGDSEVKDESYNPDKKPLKRKSKTSQTVKRKRLKLDPTVKLKLKTKVKDKTTEEGSVDDNTEESQSKRTLKRSCVLCKGIGLQFNNSKVMDQIYFPSYNIM